MAASLKGIDPWLKKYLKINRLPDIYEVKVQSMKECVFNLFLCLCFALSLSLSLQHASEALRKKFAKIQKKSEALCLLKHLDVLYIKP